MKSRLGELEKAYENSKISDKDLLEYYQKLTELVGYMSDRGERSVLYAFICQLNTVEMTIDARMLS